MPAPHPMSTTTASGLNRSDCVRISDTRKGCSDGRRQLHQLVLVIPKPAGRVFRSTVEVKLAVGISGNATVHHSDLVPERFDVKIDRAHQRHRLPPSARNRSPELDNVQVTSVAIYAEARR